ncbi:MAG: sugar ABC transporter substrate-binding protein [Thermodesulfobacteriota bacterium]
MREQVMLLVIAVLLLVAGCAEEQGEQPGVMKLQAWVHAGQQAERLVLEEQVARFNRRQQGVQLELTLIPERSYNAQIQAAALAGDLPDLLEFDGPYLANYVWQGHLRPLDDLLPSQLKDDLLPSIITQGTYRGRLFAVGVFDSGLGLYGRRSQLLATGARIPARPDEAWGAEEFSRLLKELAKGDADGAVLDLKFNYPGEWFTYAFSPIVQSAGGDLLDRRHSGKAAGVLDSSESVGALTQLQSWLAAGYVDGNVDDAAFVSGRVALSWAGHWEYRRYKEMVGDDLVALPLPDFGYGSRTGQGSWCWGITATGDRAKAAGTFLRFLLRPAEVLAMSGANGAVPATHSALAQSELYGPRGPLHLFAEQLSGGISVTRPRTPAYPVITSAFQQAFHDIRHGADVRTTLQRAAAIIDEDIADNKGYP